MTTPLTEAWLSGQIATMIDEGEDPGPDDSLILFGLDSIRVMEFVALLEQHGYLHYEISNFARMGFQCRHNMGYWEGEDPTWQFNTDLPTDAPSAFYASRISSSATVINGMALQSALVVDAAASVRSVVVNEDLMLEVLPRI